MTNETLETIKNRPQADTLLHYTSVVQTGRNFNSICGFLAQRVLKYHFVPGDGAVFLLGGL
jgi:hypothetical protein